MLSMSVSVECGVLSVEYDSAVSGEPPLIPPWPGLKRVIGLGSSVLWDTCVLNGEIVT
jgi:hypothetical protein